MAADAPRHCGSGHAMNDYGRLPLTPGIIKGRPYHSEKRFLGRPPCSICCQEPLLHWDLTGPREFLRSHTIVAGWWTCIAL